MKSSLLVVLLLPFVFCIPFKQTNTNEVITLQSGGTEGNLSVSVNTDTGAYYVTVDGEIWFNGPLFAFHLNGTWYNSAEKTLKLSSSNQGKGTDTYLGPWTSIELEWYADTIPVVTTFKSYANTQALVFQASFPNGAQRTNIDINSDVITAFPVFSDFPSSLNFYTNVGMFGAPAAGVLANKDLPGGISGGPAFVYNSALRTIAISPLDAFMVSIHAWSAALGGESLAFGINGKVLELPAGFTYSTILYGGQGIRDTSLQWGAALLGYYGKKPATLDADEIISNLGYWTDDGGYYWYNTEPDKNYQETIIDIMNDIRNISLPVKNFQLDSWWYYKGINDGVYTWTPQTEVFPNGMGYVQEHLKIPFALHNRYFSPDTPYQHNYTMIVESWCALPQDENLFLDIMGASKTWGNILYEQDWLITTYENMNATQNNVTAGWLWLTSMGNAASKLDLTIQYCMPLPLHLLQSVEIQPVTQSRCTGDYVPGTDQWQVAYPSMFLWSIGLVPYRDDFWSTSWQPACYNMDGRGNHCWEPNTWLMALTASLTAGPVGPSDKIGNLNKELIMYTSRDDGKLIKPDFPAMPLDVVFSSTFNSPTANLQIWQTSTTISGFAFHYIFGAQLTSPFELKITDLPNATNSTNYSVVDFFEVMAQGTSAQILPFDSEHPLTLPTSGPPSLTNTTVDFRYFVAVPQLSPCSPIGEITKFITVSAQRTQSIQVTSSSVTVSLIGAPGETVEYWFLKNGNSAFYNASVTLNSNGIGSVSCP